MDKEPLDIDLSKTDRSISKGLDQAGKADGNLISLSSGVVLEARQANPQVLIRVISQHKRPQPPTYFNESMGRNMENPEDPDYIGRVQAWGAETTAAMLYSLISLGTSLKSKPENVPGPQDDTWLKEYSFLGIDMHADSPSWRYVNWVMYIAAPTAEDTQKIQKIVQRLSGVQEADVRDAENFPESN